MQGALLLFQNAVPVNYDCVLTSIIDGTMRIDKVVFKLISDNMIIIYIKTK